MPHKLSLQPKYGPHSIFAGEDKTLPPTVIGENNVFCDGAVIFAGSMIGNHNFIGNNASIREFVNIGNDCMIGRNVTIECHTTIGNYVVIQTGAHITGDMLIEDRVFIGPEACTMNDKYMGARDIKMEGPIFREGCHIGANATILSGVEIGKGAVVGAGSVVTKNVLAGEVWVGNPAKYLKKVKEIQ